MVMFFYHRSLLVYAMLVSRDCNRYLPALNIVLCLYRVPLSFNLCRYLLVLSLIEIYDSFVFCRTTCVFFFTVDRITLSVPSERCARMALTIGSYVVNLWLRTILVLSFSISFYFHSSTTICSMRWMTFQQDDVFSSFVG